MTYNNEIAILPCDIKNIDKLLRYTQKLHNFDSGQYTHNYLITALLTCKTRSAFGVNNYGKTHTATIQPSPQDYLITIHAEVDAIRNWSARWSFSNRYHLKLYTLGLTRNGNFCQFSKPCNSCMNLIRSLQISEIIYCCRNQNDFCIKKELI
jgi:tRNA(Arg) A34 adenosine deaminase TadA